jgi:transposase, IS5 family
VAAWPGSGAGAAAGEPGDWVSFRWYAATRSPSSSLGGIPQGLPQAQENANRRKSRVRARIEHVFGAQQNSPGGRIVRTIGIARAKAKIGLQNLAYNIRRLVTLERMAAA